MDIKSGSSYPSSALSNFAPHPFYMGEVLCNSMEGFLQSLKFKNPDMQIEVCKMVGRQAKDKGSNKNWKKDQTLYWQGKQYKRDNKEYQELLDMAFKALSENSSFKKALLSTGKSTLTHNAGKKKITDTVLTKSEFCGRLTKLRDNMKRV